MNGFYINYILNDNKIIYNIMIEKESNFLFKKLILFFFTFFILNIEQTKYFLLLSIL